MIEIPYWWTLDELVKLTGKLRVERSFHHFPPGTHLFTAEEQLN